MIKIRDFIEKGFKISWTLLNIGWGGSAKFKRQLAGQDVIDFAMSKMEDGEELTDVVLLASSHATNAEEISKLLKRLSDGEEIDFDNEFRKWRAVYVSKNLPDIQVEYIQGLIELGDIWALFDFPDDSPHVFQRRDNSITPNEYYTRENYIRLLEKHQEWLEKEVADLRNK